VSTARAPERPARSIPPRAQLAPDVQPYERRTRRPAPPLRVVERSRARRRVGAFSMLVTLVVFASLFGAVVSSTWRVQSQQHLDQLNRDVATAQARYESLRLQVAHLEAPDRIVHDATQRLGMVQPANTTYLLPPPTDTAPESGDTTHAETAQGQWDTVKPYLGQR
jgi:cell division protein FtsL